MSDFTILSIDGGGTKTTFSLFNAQGVLLKEIRMPSVHLLSQSKEESLRILEMGVNSLDPSCTAYVVAGLAGFGNDKNIKKTFLEVCTQAFGKREFYLTDDVEIAMTGALNGNDGVIVISGTGSIAQSKQGQTIKRCGGWGYQIGDEGSAYWVAKRLISEFCNQSDGREEKTLLYDLLKAYLQLDDDSDIIHYFQVSTRSEIAALAMIVKEAANKGDKTAIQILYDAGKELSKLANTLLSDFAEDTFITYSGGLFVHTDRFILNGFIDHITKECTIIRPIHSPTYGGYLIGKKFYE